MQAMLLMGLLFGQASSDTETQKLLDPQHVSELCGRAESARTVDFKLRALAELTTVCSAAIAHKVPLPHQGRIRSIAAKAVKDKEERLHRPGLEIYRAAGKSEDTRTIFEAALKTKDRSTWFHVMQTIGPDESVPLFAGIANSPKASTADRREAIRFLGGIKTSKSREALQMMRPQSAGWLQDAVDFALYQIDQPGE